MMAVQAKGSAQGMGRCLSIVDATEEEMHLNKNEACEPVRNTRPDEGHIQL
jgi:hypothetical protein